MQQMNKLPRLSAAALVCGLAVLAAGCGSASTDKSAENAAAERLAKYCDALKAARSDIAGFASTTGSPDLSRFSDVVTEINTIADEAPPDAKTTWETLAKPLTAMDEALKAAGTDLKAMVGSAATGKLPKGVTPEEMTSLGQQLMALQDPKLRESGSALSGWAKQDCGFDLEATS